MTQPDKTAKPEKIDIFSYTDYRQLLKDLYDQFSKKTFFSQRYLAKAAGLGSHSYIRMVLKGQRNLSPQSIAKFATAFKMNKKEASYFEALVFFNQATDTNEKEHYFEKLITIKPLHQISKIAREQYEYLINRHYVVIREMTAMKDFREDLEWIGEKLNPPAKPKEVERAIEVLLKLKLLRRDESGKLIHTRTALETAPDVLSLEIYNYHRTMLNEAMECMLNTPYQDRDFSAMTIPVAKNQIGAIQDILSKARAEIISLISRGKKEFDEVYQVNVHLYPLTRQPTSRNPSSQEDK